MVILEILALKRPSQRVRKKVTRSDGKNIDKYHYVSINRRIEKNRYIFLLTTHIDIFLTCRVNTVQRQRLVLNINIYYIVTCFRTCSLLH